MAGLVDSLSLGNEREDQAQLSSVQRVRFNRGDHEADSRQALSDGVLLRLVFQQDARAA